MYIHNVAKFLYHINNKDEKPPFNYIAILIDEVDEDIYYCYDKIDDAISKAKQLSTDYQKSRIYDYYFCTKKMKWRLRCIMEFIDEEEMWTRRCIDYEKY